MTRAIKDIYADIQTLKNNEPSMRGNHDYYENHSGDTQIIENSLLKTMFDAVINFIRFYQKETFDEPYAMNKIWLLNSNWWSLTSEQATERTDFINDGYKNTYRKTSSAPSDSTWNIDENNQWKQPEFVVTTPAYNDELRTYFYTKRADSPRITKIANFSEHFFDPAIIQIETLPQLNAWLDELDSIITTLKTYTYIGGSVSTKVSTQSGSVNWGYSDLYTGDSNYNDDSWYDDQAETSGDFVRQTISISRSGGGSYTANIYSEDRTVQHDDGEGGYTPVTYSTTDSFTGAAFGIDALGLFNIAIVLVGSDWEDEFNSSPSYYYTVTEKDLDAGLYDADKYTTNRANEIKMSETDKVYDMSSSVAPHLTSREVKRNIVTWENGEEQYTGTISGIAPVELDPSLIAELKTTIEDQIIEVDFGLPTHPTEYISINTQYFSESGFDMDYFTIHNLTPPD